MVVVVKWSGAAGAAAAGGEAVVTDNVDLCEPYHVAPAKVLSGEAGPASFLPFYGEVGRPLLCIFFSLKLDS